jgi:Pvc16 N-terminal domain
VQTREPFRGPVDDDETPVGLRALPGDQGGHRRMIIPTIDAGLETLLRQGLPLPDAVGDISFESPSGTWSAQINRITVNLFLFGVGRSGQPPRPATDRTVNGRAQRRHPIPMLELHYLVSAWAGVVRDEHQLLGDALACVLNTQVLPPEHLGVELRAGVQLAIAPYDNTRAKDVWSTVGGAIKPSFELIVTTAGDASPFFDLPPSVERIAALVAPHPKPGD